MLVEMNGVFPCYDVLKGRTGFCFCRLNKDNPVTLRLKCMRETIRLPSCGQWVPTVTFLVLKVIVRRWRYLPFAPPNCWGVEGRGSENADVRNCTVAGSSRCLGVYIERRVKLLVRKAAAYLFLSTCAFSHCSFWNSTLFIACSSSPHMQQKMEAFFYFPSKRKHSRIIKE